LQKQIAQVHRKKKEEAILSLCQVVWRGRAGGKRKEAMLKVNGKRTKTNHGREGIHTQKPETKENPQLKSKGKKEPFIHSPPLHPSAKLPFLVVAALPPSTSSALLPITSPLAEFRMLSSMRYLCTAPTLGGRLSGSSSRDISGGGGRMLLDALIERECVLSCPSRVNGRRPGERLRS
jgi:hypothetical protein